MVKRIDTLRDDDPFPKDRIIYKNAEFRIGDPIPVLPHRRKLAGSECPETFGKIISIRYGSPTIACVDVRKCGNEGLIPDLSQI